GNLINAPVTALGAVYIARYSQSDEYEADRGGQKLAAAAGYDPQALAPILARLERFVELKTGEERIPSFFDTHPSTPDRMERVTEYGQKLEWTPQSGVARTSAEYLLRLEGLLVGANPAVGVFQDRVFLHPGLDLSINFPGGWKALNTHQAVIAVPPKKDAMLVFGIAGKGTDPEQAAATFARALKAEFGVDPTTSKSMRISELPAYLVAYKDTSGKEPTYLAFLWIAYRGLLYQFMGLAPESYRETLRATAFSFRPMTAQERASIKETRLHIVSARGHETLSQLCQRTKNVWDLKTTSVMNGVDEDQALKEGQLIKIAILQPYQAP
ncbi:MAG: M48 family metalloprotease, partial [Deltaproteobacteria bacterium]